MKRFERGLLFGKFLPPHKGHLHMIDSAIKNCEEVIVLVCSLEREPINGMLRFAWLSQIYRNNPKVTIKHVKEEVPQYPHEHVDFWNIWTDLLKRYAPSVDVVYTSEDYGYEVAARLGIRHEIVDQERRIVPVSGTAVRTNPIANWEFIPDVVKPYFAKRIVLTGAESTGKSTMALAIGKHYNTHVIDEYGREYCEALPRDHKLTPEDFVAIAKGYIKKFHEEKYLCGKIQIQDTDLIVTEAYANMYLGECPEYISNLNAAMSQGLSHHSNILHLVPDIDVPWEDDGARIYLKDEQRKDHVRMIIRLLEKYNYPYYIITGNSLDNKLRNALGYIETFFPELNEKNM